jgi:hypothetical protein
VGLAEGKYDLINIIQPKPEEGKFYEMEERIFDFLNASGILVVDIKGFIKDSCLFSNDKRVEEVKSFS